MEKESKEAMGNNLRSWKYVVVVGAGHAGSEAAP